MANIDSKFLVNILLFLVRTSVMFRLSSATDVFKVKHQSLITGEISD